MLTGSDDTVVLVAGGGSGIGLATVDRLRTAGARPIVLDLDVSGVPSGIDSWSVDLTDYPATLDAVRDVHRRSGVVTTAINCAGLAASGAFLDSAPAQWSRSISVNLLTCVHLAHAVLPGMVERGFGRLVFVSSAAAQMGLSDDAIYAAAKAGVEGLTRALALEFARSGVTVNCVAPGPVQTALFDRQAERTREAIVRHVPMRRVGHPDEIARVLTFLTSPGVSFLSGQVIGVNGALHVGH